MSIAPVPTSDLAEILNRTCGCLTLDEARLDAALRSEATGLGLSDLVATHPHLFSKSAVFVDPATADAMTAVVAAIERAVALPSYQELVMQSAHPHARTVTQARGAFLGFDFHLATDGPRLIEVNTNAGGGLLNALLRRAQRACCAPVAQALDVEAGAEPRFFEMMLEEWRLCRGQQPCTSIAIVDDDPSSQYLFPEFVLFRALSEARGIPATICDASELEVRADALYHGDRRIDLVYNRVTDFSLEEPRHAALAEAFARDLAVVTPHPRAYALYADKRRLAVLSDRDALAALGVLENDQQLLLEHVPRTREVTTALRDELWKERRELFFKPATGFGAKAAYRGEGLTKRVFDEIMSSPYVAQRLVRPSTRTLTVEGAPSELKADLRVFAYRGEVQLRCARLYQGQTTNFRSRGGGFAPVYTVATDDANGACAPSRCC